MSHRDQRCQLVQSTYEILGNPKNPWWWVGARRVEGGVDLHVPAAAGKSRKCIS